MAYVYFILDRDYPAVKIGKANDWRCRLAELQIGNPRQLILIGLVEAEDALAKEAELHQRFRYLRVGGEWFRYTRQIETWIRKHAQAQPIGMMVQDRELAAMLMRMQEDGASGECPP